MDIVKNVLTPLQTFKKLMLLTVNNLHSIYIYTLKNYAISKALRVC